LLVGHWVAKAVWFKTSWLAYICYDEGNGVCSPNTTRFYLPKECQ